LRLLPWEYAVRNLGRAPLRLALMVGGSALVVMLVLVAGGFVNGMRQSLRSSGEDNNIILLGAGSEESVERSEVQSGVGTLLQASVPGIRTTLGVVHISPEVQLQTVLHETPDDQRRQAAPLRGFTPAAFLVHPRLRIVEGKLPEVGRDQIMVGALAHFALGLPQQRLAVGRQLWFENRPWTITGIFESGGTVMESEVWMPLTDLQIAARRDTISCVVATLGDADFSDVDLFARQRLDLELVALGEADYYRKQAQFFMPIQVMVIVTAGLVAVGGLLGGLNTMYAAFAARVRELGALQTLGYPRRAIVLSLIQESVLATGVGVLVACAIGILLLDGLSVRFSMGAFGIRIDSAVVAVGMLAGLLLGVIGALPPAFACLRLPITQALKSS